MTSNKNTDHRAESSQKPSPPAWFWVISILALLWYLMDTASFFMRVFMLDSMLASMPETQQNLYLNMPLWVNIAYSAEVFGGLLGSIGLLLKKKLALIPYVISLAGVVSQTFYLFFLSDAIQIAGTPAIAMPLLAIAIGIGLIYFTKFANSRHWIS